MDLPWSGVPAQENSTLPSIEDLRKACLGLSELGNTSLPLTPSGTLVNPPVGLEACLGGTGTDQTSQLLSNLSLLNSQLKEPVDLEGLLANSHDRSLDMSNSDALASAGFFSGGPLMESLQASLRSLDIQDSEQSLQQQASVSQDLNLDLLPLIEQMRLLQQVQQEQKLREQQEELLREQRIQHQLQLQRQQQLRALEQENLKRALLLHQQKQQLQLQLQQQRLLLLQQQQQKQKLVLTPEQQSVLAAGQPWQMDSSMQVQRLISSIAQQSRRPVPKMPSRQSPSGRFPSGPKQPMSAPQHGKLPSQGNLRAQPPSWAGSNWNPRSNGGGPSSAGTGVFLPNLDPDLQPSANSNSSKSNNKATGSPDASLASENMPSVIDSNISAWSSIMPRSCMFPDDH